jgi:hypothetical protein
MSLLFQPAIVQVLARMRASGKNGGVLSHDLDLVAIAEATADGSAMLSCQDMGNTFSVRSVTE